MFRVSRIVVPHSVSLCVALDGAHEINNKNDDINHDDNNTDHIDACILVFICVVVAAVISDAVLKKFDDPGRPFVDFL